MADIGNIGVRSPYFISESDTLVTYGTLTITINSTLQYTITKDVDAGSTRVTIDVSNLIRDFIEPSYDGTLASASIETYVGRATLSMTLKLYNASNVQVGTDYTYTGYAFDAYNYFSEGNNANFSNNTNLLSGSTIWAPEDTSGKFVWITSTGDVQVDTYAAGDTSEVNAAGTVSIKRYPCSRYDAIKCVFINKFGVHQELYFFGKTIESTKTSSESYKSNYLSSGGVVDTNRHQIVTYNKQGQTSYILNTGFVGEEYTEFVRELMLSEYVWLHIDSDIKPVTPKTSSVTFKTGLNDKLVEYTVEFEQANDLIANIR